MAVLDIIINTAAHAAARPLLAQKGGTRPGSPPLMTAGDGWDGNVSLRLWFYNAESGAITSTNVRKAGVSLALYAKQSRTEAAPYLFEVAGFSEFQDGEGNYGYEAPVNLNTVELLAAVASGSSADAWVDVVEDGDATTQFQVTIRPQVDSGGALPSPAEPPYPHPSQLATKADLDALRGGVPLANAWENPMDSAFFEAGNITITDGVPTALYGTGPMNLVANALPDWQPDTLDISGVLQAGTATNCTAFFTFIDATGNEVLAPSGRLAVTISGAGNGEFSIVSASVPAGATRLAFGYDVIDSQQPCEFSAGLVSIGLTAHANLSELTAEALADILADKAQALADAGTVAALVAPAQTDAQTVADLVAPAGTAKDNAEAYAASAYTAMVNAGNSNKVATDDWRLGLRGGVACTAGGSTTSTAFAPCAPFPLVTLGIEGSPLAAAAAVRVLWSTGTGNTTSDLRLKIATDGKLLFDEGNGSGFTSSTAYAAAGARWIWCVYNATANTIDVYADSSDTPVWTYSRINATALNAITYIGGTGSTTGYTGTVRAVCALNFAATHADRIAAMRGEYPQAWLGGVRAASSWAGAWTDQSWTSDGGTITTNSAGTLVASSPAATALYALKAVSLIPTGGPALVPGRKLRIRYDLTLTGGVAPVMKFQQGNVDTTVTLQLTAGTGVVQDFTFGVVGLAEGINVLLQTMGASNFTLSNVSLEILGAQVLVGPQDWAGTRGVDMSGNCNDLVYGTGVVAIEPATKVRVIAATAAGATVSAGAVATVGTLSGATYRDAKALAALRQWDSVSANWRQARPANCAALQAAVATAGTPLVEATAITGNAVISANAALNLTHTIN